MAFLFRLLSILVGLLLCGLVFPGSIALGALVWGTLMLLGLYLLLRPVMQAISTPFNLFLFGLVTPITDALFILWTQAWVLGMSLNYGECIVAAIIISVCYFPYSLYKQHRLLKVLHQ